MTSGNGPVLRIALLAASILVASGLFAARHALAVAQSASKNGQSSPTQAEMAAVRAQRAAWEAQRAADQAVVDRYFPDDLVDPSHPHDGRNCFAVYDRGADGAPATIFAVYEGSGPYDEMLVIARKERGEYRAQDVGEGRFNLPGSLSCSVDTLAIDRSGSKVVTVSLSGNDPGEAVWVFRWDGSQLDSIGPTSPSPGGPVDSDLTDPSFVNLYGDGTLAAVSQDGFSREEAAPVPISIYRLRHGNYVLSGHGVDALDFMCGVHCDAQTDEFTVSEDSRGPYVLQLGNGDLDGGSRVHAARIQIDGKEIAGVARLNERVGALTLPIPELHPGSNTISGTLVRAPGVRVGKLNYAILDHPAQQ